MMLRSNTAYFLGLAFAACFLAGCNRAVDEPKQAAAPNIPSPRAAEPRKPAPVIPTPRVEAPQKPAPIIPSPPIVAAARSQIGRTVTYDPAYVRLEYPMGDVPIDRGVCIDVVIRALRDAINTDLQKLIHEDMKAAFSAYPTIWGLRRPDRNIDHRRVPNLKCYFKRKGLSLRVSQDKQDYLPGDIVTCSVSNRPHIMIVSDRKTSGGVPLVIHNIGRGAQEEDSLFEFKITGHYRTRQTARIR
jgi:uncharacterized protein